MNRIFKQVATGTAAFTLMTTVFATGAMAADDNPITTQVTGTESVQLTDAAVTPFSGVTLDGTTKILNASIGSFTVKDARGTGAGWKVSVKATPFTHAVEGPLSAGSVVLTAPTVAVIDENSSLAAEVKTLGGAIDGSTVEILSAGADQGMGSYTISEMPMELTLKPKEVYAGTYTSTVTVSLVTGP